MGGLSVRPLLCLVSACVFAISSAHAIEMRVHRGGAFVLGAQDYFRHASEVHIPEGALPDTDITTGTGYIRRVWLTQPTDRCGHGVMRNAIEAGTFSKFWADSTTFRLKLVKKSVFEDHKTRLAKMNGDGRDAIASRSHRSISVLSFRR